LVEAAADQTETLQTADLVSAVFLELLARRQFPAFRARQAALRRGITLAVEVGPGPLEERPARLSAAPEVPERQAKSTALPMPVAEAAVAATASRPRPAAATDLVRLAQAMRLRRRQA
jgi:hypothetical protein